MSLDINDVFYKSSDDIAFEKVKEFIEKNPTKLNEFFSENNSEGTLLHFSCFWKNHPKVVSYLLSKNADVTKCFSYFGGFFKFDGLTAKQIAEKNGYGNIVTLFEQYEREQASREKLNKISNPILGEVEEKPDPALQPIPQPKPVPVVISSPNPQPESDVAAHLKALGYDQYIESFYKFGAKSIDDILLFEEEDWKNLNVMPFHKKKILASIPKKDSQHQGSTTVLQERGNRREPPTARLTPGKRFLEIIPKVLATPKSVIDGLKKHASDNQLPLIIIQNFQDKIEDFSETNSPECAFAMALCWLYTTESWVYPQVNNLLRDDSSTMISLAPFMRALIESYKNLEGDHSNFHSGVVYRRTKLTPKGLEFYKPNLHFVWSAFTSTAIEFNPSGEFGSILFEITIPEIFKKYALCLENISAFPTEREVLMLPNIAYKVVSIQNNPHQYPNTTCVIKVSIEYVCLVV